VCAGADVVHAHGLRAGLLASLALSALPGRRARRTPLVVTRHSAVVADGQRARMLRLLERRVSRTATVVLGTATDLVDRARSLGARDARLAPAALPVPLPGQRTAGGPDGLREGTARDRARAELGVRGRPLLVSAGRLEEHKGYDTLLDAARVWRDARPAPLALIAGDGSRRAALARRIEAERLPVRLLGPGAEALLLAAGDLAVLPSRWEGRSRLAQQALRTGLPLVATAVGGVPELVGEAAALVPYGDPLALAAEVTGLLADADRRAALALAGRAQAAGWPTEDDTVAQVLSVYDELTAAAP
jgi:glycosyltransferase involved in cell wall biosynthesis